MVDRREGRGLGRGLSALMADVDLKPVRFETLKEIADEKAQKKRQPDMVVPIEKVKPNPDQPRRMFSQDQLDDLTNSIREKGVIQPLIVRPQPGMTGMYQIVAGERRWRAAQRAQLHELPVVVRDFNDTEVLEVAIIENIQRADLNAVEEAAGYRQLMDKFGHTQEKLAEALGKSRSHIANLMRLLSLPPEVLDYLRQGLLSAGHARALITAQDPVALAKMVISKKLSVRETERLAKGGDLKEQPTRGKRVKDADTKVLEQDLSSMLKMGVSISHKDTGKGSLTISYENLEELDGLCAILAANPRR